MNDISKQVATVQDAARVAGDAMDELVDQFNERVGALHKAFKNTSAISEIKRLSPLITERMVATDCEYSKGFLYISYEVFACGECCYESTRLATRYLGKDGVSLMEADAAMLFESDKRHEKEKAELLVDPELAEYKRLKLKFESQPPQLITIDCRLTRSTSV